MTHGYNDAEVRVLLFHLLRVPERERETLLAQERERRSEIAASAEQAFAEVMVLLDRLPEDPQACRAALAAGSTLHPLILEAVEHVLGLGEQPPLFEPLPPLQFPELLPNYSPELAEGTTFGHYLIEKQLARGGMGVVYLARDQFLHYLTRDQSLLGDLPRRALKILLHLDAVSIDCFMIEMGILNELAKESNVVGIHGFGLKPAPFIAMEYVEGGSLADALESKAWPGQGCERARSAAQLVRTLARTLQVAHVAGIFHLDMKPANVLLHEKRGPLLADFSLARRVRDGSDPIDVPAGTPAYLAPEQAARSPNVKPALIDVYGLGVILYELLTGRPPFLPAEGESLTKLLRRIRTQEPSPPSALDDEVPSDLEAICLRCLRKNPAERYQSAEKVADELDAFLRGDQPSAVRWPWHRRARHFVRRRWVGIAVGLALSALSLAFVVSIILFLASRADAAEVEAKGERERAGHAEEVAQRERQHHRQQIHAAALSSADKGDWKLAMELYESALRDYAADDPERLPLEVERLPGWFLYRSRQDVAAELNRLDRSAELAAKERAKVRLYQADLRLSEDGRTPAILALLRKSLASGALDKADALYAESLLAPSSRASLAKLRELIGVQPGHYRARVALLGLLFVRGQLDELREWLRLHQDRFQNDPTAALLGALLDILQADDLDGALVRLDGARDRLGEERWRRGRAFLTEWAKLLRTVAREEVPNPAAILRLKAIIGGDKDIFSLNVPTISWLGEHWGAAASAFAFSLLGIFLAPEAVLEKWRTLCEDSPEATFLINQALAELAVARSAEKRGRKDETVEHAKRAVDLSYRAADARTPTLLPRSEWRYKALHMAILTEVALLQTSGQAAEPEREKRLRDGVRRVVTEGRAHLASRAQRLPQIVGHLSRVARSSPQSLSPEMAHTLLIEWMQEEADNPVPYRLRAKLALDFDRAVTAWSIVALWYADKRHPKDAQLDELGKKAKEGVGRLFSPAAP